ncbi:zinc finger protein 687a-like [Tribolium madens]|uniref:zinc finger protein 687a-like n=1 Tax=Tribolium madens TaxID=41895 RepID=UPI001CF73D08|nr:zinc finger protein 687a-like [Tribolium madens]
MLSANSSVSWTKKHSLLSKWNILFDKSPEWISFKPQLGLKVYPCYSCKNMFSSKLTFQDHINRRVVIIKYKCMECTNTFTFYNRCSLLLHARKHFSLGEGKINLANVDIFLLPVDLAGFARHESIPFLYDEEEEYPSDNSYVNCQFYTPDDADKGKQMVTFRPFNLVFHYAEGSNNVLLVIKQLTLNIPLCEFVPQNLDKQAKTVQVTNGHLEPEIKQEIDEDFTLPVISKIESLPQCSECNSTVEGPLVGHFQGANKPLDESLCCYICKYVAPTKCSLKAHVRTHENIAPHVCPECGKQFNTWTLLDKHMEDVCFHLSKQVRFRCPALKCGKLFVMPNTYASHFANHFQSILRCSVCSSNFFTESDFTDHAKNHESCTSFKTFNCTVCKNMPTLGEEKTTEHVNWHLRDRETCVYIFTCRSCRSYFRSTTTYSVHKQRCLKNEKTSNIITASCQFCSQKIQYKEKDALKVCTNCKQINHLRGTPSKSNEEKKSTCMLCKEDLLPENVKSHTNLCKYNNPIVTIHAINESKDSDETSSSEPSNLDSSNDSLKTEETSKTKKRKRTSNSSTPSKSKKPAEENDLQAEKPISFDGTYYCKLCDYKNTERSEFHNHVKTHRDISTAYQCMECGECFVVKPSLVKHLAHFHQVTDSEQYFAENSCYDKFAIEELENNLRLVPGEHKGPVKENQCSVCLEEFEDALALSKHFRIHGMAFLMKKTK